VRIRYFLSVLVLLLVAGNVPAVGQTDAGHPNLSGTWKLNPAKSKVPKGADIGSGTIHIDCFGSTFRIDGAGDAMDQSRTWIADGEEHSVMHVEPEGRQRGYDLIHIAYWKKASLVTEVNIHVNADAGSRASLPPRVVRWTLSKDGRQLSRESDDPKQILVYDKQP